MPKPALAVVLDVSFVEWVCQMVEETMARELLKEYDQDLDRRLEEAFAHKAGAKVIPFAQTEAGSPYPMAACQKRG